MGLSRAELDRYSRHLSLAEVGRAGQERLRSARVLVIGAGGLGSPAALYLAASGVGTLGVLDCDRVELSNLQRQVLFDTAALSRQKAAAARERLVALNPEIQIHAHETELCAANVMQILSQYDIVLDGTDRVATRYLVNDACVLLRKPLVSAAIHRFEGQAMTYVPGRGPCYRCLFASAEPGQVATCAEAGVLGVLPGVLGTIQATEAIKVILGIGAPLIGRLLMYDALSMRFDELQFARRSDCAVCGDHRTIMQPQDADRSCAPDIPTRRISPAELQELLRRSAAAAPILLIDVREPHEFEARHMEGARNIPVAQLERRLGELPAQGAKIFICRSGTRSLAACRLAVRAGMADAADLEGGLLAWSREIDPAFEVPPP